MAVYNVELRRSNGSNYEDKIYLKTSVGLVEGLLDENDKIRASLLPSFVLGSMRFVTIWQDTQNNTLEHLHTNVIDPYITNNGGSARGCYVVVGRTMQVSVSDGYTLFTDEIGGESGPLPHSSGQITIERGDWLICINDSGKVWAVLNNTYPDATVTTKGVVQLATEQDGINGTSTKLVMTPKTTVAAINARAYQHPTYTARDVVFSEVETLSGLSVNSLGHVTSFVKQTIRAASESQTGLIRLASSSEAKAATEYTKAISPLRVKEMIDRFASIELVQSLPTDMNDHPAGKLILLQI